MNPLYAKPDVIPTRDQNNPIIKSATNTATSTIEHAITIIRNTGMQVKMTIPNKELFVIFAVTFTNIIEPYKKNYVVIVSLNNPNGHQLYTVDDLKKQTHMYVNQLKISHIRDAYFDLMNTFSLKTNGDSISFQTLNHTSMYLPKMYTLLMTLYDICINDDKVNTVGGATRASSCHRHIIRDSLPEASKIPKAPKSHKAPKASPKPRVKAPPKPSPKSKPKASAIKK